MTRYVLGFLMDRGFVVLVRKERPSWQKGRLNGVGGHLEEGEDELQAMVREFHEETGFMVQRERWKEFCVMSGSEGDGWEVTCFWAIGILSRCKTQTDEEIEIHSINEFYRPYQKTGMENLGWLFSMIESQKIDGVNYYKVEYNR